MSSVDLTVAARAAQRALDEHQAALQAKNALCSAENARREPRLAEARELVLDAVRAWTARSDADLVGTAIAAVDFSRDTVAYTFEIHVTTPVQVMGEPDAVEPVATMLMQRGFMYKGASYSKTRRRRWCTTLHVGLRPDPEPEHAGLEDALGPHGLAAKAAAGYDAKSAAADALVAVVHAYISGAPAPASAACLQDCLATVLPPDLVDSVARLTRGTLEDDIVREIAARPPDISQIRLPVPVPADADRDVLALVAHRVNASRGNYPAYWVVRSLFLKSGIDVILDLVRLRWWMRDQELRDSTADERLVMEQAVVNRATACRALERAGGDLSAAIMQLVM